jgi:enoyl-CoA hydratase/carnithine racemase
MSKPARAQSRAVRRAQPGASASLSRPGDGSADHDRGVSGYALGSGCELALAADFRFAGRSAKFGLSEITPGIMPGSGGTQRLPRIVGPARAKELILSGRMVAADEALAIGLADRVLADADLLNVAVEEALRYARGPLALWHAKRAVDAALDLPVGVIPRPPTRLHQRT